MSNTRLEFFNKDIKTSRWRDYNPYLKNSESNFIPMLSVDARLLEIRIRRLEWILQDAREVVVRSEKSTPYQKSLNEAFSLLLNNLNKDLIEVKNTPDWQKNLYASTHALFRWNNLAEDFNKKAKEKFMALLTQQTTDGKIFKFILEDISDCLLSDLQPNWVDKQYEKLNDEFNHYLIKLKSQHDSQLQILGKSLSETNAIATADEKAPFRKPSCYICYARNESNEKWLTILYQQLTKAGVIVYLDICREQKEISNVRFAEKLNNCDYVIVMGTPDLKNAWEDPKSTAPHKTEIEQVCAKKIPNLIKLLLTGENQTSFPVSLEHYSFVDFSNKKEYFYNFFKLIAKIFENHHVQLAYINKIQKDFNKQQTIITNEYQYFEELRNQLKEYYKKQNTIKRLFYPIALPLQGNYIHLSVVNEKEQADKEINLLNHPNEEISAVYKDLYTPKNTVSMASIVNNNLSNKSTRILITGIAGVGKTTFSQYLSYAWANSNSIEEKEFKEFSSWDKKYSLVFRIRLRDMISDKYQKNKNLDAIDILIDSVSWNTQESGLLKLSAENKALLKKQIEAEEKAGHILIILDGYDEIARNLSAKIQEILKELLTARHVILTSRPYYLDDLSVKYLFNYTECHYRITGFTDDNISQYIANFFTKLLPNPKTKSGETLNNYLKKHSSLWGPCHVPINLELICGAWEQHPFSEVITKPLTMSELYTKVIISLCRRYLSKIDAERNISCLKSELVLSECSEQLEFLEHWAFSSINEHKLTGSLTCSLEYIHKKYHKTVANKKWGRVSEKVVHDLLMAGFFKSIGSGTDEADKEYYFPHRTFQEYFAAGYIKRAILDNTPLGTMEDPQQSPFKYIEINRFDVSLEIMWWFVSGLLYLDIKNINKPMLRKFFECLFSQPRDVLGNYQALLAIRCWDEAHAEEVYLTNNNDIKNIIMMMLQLLLKNAQLDYLQPMLERLSISYFACASDTVNKFCKAKIYDEDKISNAKKFFETVKFTVPEISKVSSSNLDAKPRLYPSNNNDIRILLDAYQADKTDTKINTLEIINKRFLAHENFFQNMFPTGNNFHDYIRWSMGDFSKSELIKIIEKSLSIILPTTTKIYSEKLVINLLKILKHISHDVVINNCQDQLLSWLSLNDVFIQMGVINFISEEISKHVELSKIILPKLEKKYHEMPASVKQAILQLWHTYNNFDIIDKFESSLIMSWDNSNYAEKELALPWLLLYFNPDSEDKKTKYKRECLTILTKIPNQFDFQLFVAACFVEWIAKITSYQSNAAIFYSEMKRHTVSIVSSKNSSGIAAWLTMIIMFDISHLFEMLDESTKKTLSCNNDILIKRLFCSLSRNDYIGNDDISDAYKIKSVLSLQKNALLLSNVTHINELQNLDYSYKTAIDLVFESINILNGNIVRDLIISYISPDYFSILPITKHDIFTRFKIKFYENPRFNFKSLLNYMHKKRSDGDFKFDCDMNFSRPSINDLTFASFYNEIKSSFMGKIVRDTLSFINRHPLIKDTLTFEDCLKTFIEIDSANVNYLSIDADQISQYHFENNDIPFLIHLLRLESTYNILLEFIRHKNKVLAPVLAIRLLKESRSLVFINDYPCLYGKIIEKHNKKIPKEDQKIITSQMQKSFCRIYELDNELYRWDSLSLTVDASIKWITLPKLSDRLCEITLTNNINSLLYAVTYASLLPVLDDDIEFCLLFTKLFGTHSGDIIKKIKDLLKSYDYTGTFGNQSNDPIIETFTKLINTNLQNSINKIRLSEKFKHCSQLELISHLVNQNVAIYQPDTNGELILLASYGQVANPLFSLIFILREGVYHFCLQPQYIKNKKYLPNAIDMKSEVDMQHSKMPNQDEKHDTGFCYYLEQDSIDEKISGTITPHLSIATDPQKASEDKLNQIKKLLLNISSKHQFGVLSIPKENSFFCSVAQGIQKSIPINTIQHGIDSKNLQNSVKLRLLCGDYITSMNKQSNAANWFKQQFLNRAKDKIRLNDRNKSNEAIQSEAMSEYLNHILAYRNKAVTGSMIETYDLEGQIICEVLDIQLHVVVINTLTQDIIHKLINKSGRMIVNEQVINYNDDNIAHIICYDQMNYLSLYREPRKSSSATLFYHSPVSSIQANTNNSVTASNSFN